jgi:hypothetical protein
MNIINLVQHLNTACGTCVTYLYCVFILMNYSTAHKFEFIGDPCSISVYTRMYVTFLLFCLRLVGPICNAVHTCTRRTGSHQPRALVFSKHSSCGVFGISTPLSKGITGFIHPENGGSSSSRMSEKPVKHGVTVI